MIKIEDILYSKSAVKIINYLIFNEEETITRLAKNIGLNHKLIKKHVDRLANLGVIKVVRLGRIKVVKLNRDHELYKKLKNIIQLWYQ